ncbi:ABC transporter substrate-binding protein [Brucella melitensis]|nr:Hypothetical protein BMEA_B1187 [Brucella melitensis ATCC 23457]ADZ89291.1 Extracellular ligand-binding receptor [Brucella melitensis M5-90]AQQ58646.1 ABC transporter substrate-binding protein [Brucella melitensis]EEZ15943.1 predicted protein [Brucella melitensis bv. 2 str. 63/9]KDZ99888.1 hypothetical protein BV91_15745 [Brucella melitensis]
MPERFRLKRSFETRALHSRRTTSITMQTCFFRYWQADFSFNAQYFIASMDWKIREVVMI